MGALLGVEKAVIESIGFDEDAGELVACVRPQRASRGRCGECGRRAPWHDRGEGRRRWRTLDVGTIPVWLEADALRVTCTEPPARAHVRMVDVVDEPAPATRDGVSTRGAYEAVVPAA